MAIKLPFGLEVSRSTSNTSPGVSEPLPPAGIAVASQNRRSELDEIGATGSTFYSGFLGDEEYNKDLAGQAGNAVYERMSKSDGMIKAILRSIVLPIRGGIPKVEPASDDNQDVFIAHAAEKALLEMAGQTWDDFCRQAIHGMLVYGHAVHEKVYSKPNGEANLIDVDGTEVLAPYKLAPRLPKSLYQWDIDRTGELKGIVQYSFVSDRDPNIERPAAANGPTLAAGGTWKYPYIPADRLIVFSLERDGSNYLGESILRAAYKSWYYKDNLLRIQALAAERHGVGVPYAIVRQGVAQRERDAIILALRSLHAHEKGYLLVDENQLAKSAEVGMDPIGIMDMRSPGTRMTDQAIEYHDRQIALSVLADFLTLGSGGSSATGSYAMHRDKSSLFFNSLRAVVDNFEDTLNRSFMRQFVDFNFGTPKNGYPEFKLTSLETRDFERLGRSLALMATAGLLTPDAELENELREMMDLPSLPEDEDGNPIYNPKVPPPADPNAAPMDPSRPAPPEPPAPPQSDPTAKLAEDARPLADSAEQQVEALRKKTAAQIAANARRLIDEGNDYGPEDFVTGSHSTLQSAYAAAFALAAGAVASRGRTWSRDAADNQSPFLEGFARDLVAAENPDAGIDSRAELYAGQTWTGYQRGRMSGSEPDRIIWHAEGDGTTCALCDARDGEEYTLDTLPGFPGEGGFGDICEGAANCRCWLELLDSGEES